MTLQYLCCWCRTGQNSPVLFLALSSKKQQELSATLCLMQRSLLFIHRNVDQYFSSSKERDDHAAMCQQYLYLHACMETTSLPATCSLVAFLSPTYQTSWNHTSNIIHHKKVLFLIFLGISQENTDTPFCKSSQEYLLFIPFVLKPQH